MSPGFDRFESFGYDELTAKHCYFKCSRHPNVDGIKIFDKDDQATKHICDRICENLPFGHNLHIVFLSNMID